MPVSTIRGNDLRLLRVFLSVARAGGFSLAQAELNVSQSTISIQIKNLEMRLGLTLCRRGRQGFSLTEDGQRVYDAANILFNQIEDFRSVALGPDQLVGELRVAIIDNTITHPTFHFDDALRQFGALQHRIDLSLHVAPPNRLQRMVLAGEAHLAIGFFPRRFSELSYEPLFSAQMDLYCGCHHEFFTQSDRNLSKERISSAAHAQRGYVSTDQLPPCQRSFRVTARAQNIEALAHLILSGQYLAFLPTHYAARWVEGGMMRAIKSKIFSYRSTYELVRRKSTARTAGETRFHAILLDIASEK